MSIQRGKDTFLTDRYSLSTCRTKTYIFMKHLTKKGASLWLDFFKNEIITKDKMCLLKGGNGDGDDGGTTYPPPPPPWG